MLGGILVTLCTAVLAQSGQRLTGTGAALLLLAVGVTVLVWGAVGARADAGAGSWSPTGAMPQAWGYGSAVRLAGGSVLAVSGPTGDRQATSTVLYDPNSGTWIETPQVPSSGASSALVALPDGGALLVGGAVCSGLERKCLPTASSYRLNPSGWAWMPAASMHDTRADPIAVRLADGRVLVTGGFGDNCPDTVAGGYSCQPLASAEIYDPMSGQWSMAAPMPEARGGASATLLSDGSVLVVGGYGRRDAIRYSPTSGRWTTAGQTAASRAGSLLFALAGDRALTLEGESGAGFFGSLGGAADRRSPRCNPTSESFEGASNVWMVSLTEPASQSYCPTGALLAGGQVLLSSILNYSQSGPALTSPYLLDAKQRCWSRTAPPLVQRDVGNVVALRDGRALVFGGYDGDSPASLPSLSSAEIYKPGPPHCTTPPTKTSQFAGVTTAHKHHLTVTASGVIRLLEQCPGTASLHCVGHVQLTLLAPSTQAAAKNHAMHLFLGETPFGIPAVKAAWVTVHVTRNEHALRALLSQQQHVMVIITTSAYDGGYQTATTITSTTLREQHRPSN